MIAKPMALDDCLPAHAQLDSMRADPLEVRHTPAEKAAILARLTLQLAALDYERRYDGLA